jgi:hypothetical protein
MARRDFTDVSARTFGAGNLAIRPLDPAHVLIADRRIGKVLRGRK